LSTDKPTYEELQRRVEKLAAAVEELRAEKTALEILFGNAPEAIALHDNNDCIADINAEFTRVFGYSREEAVGKPINDLLASGEVTEEAEMVSEKVMRGERIDLVTKRKKKDGTMIDVSILGAPIIHEGKQIGDFAIYRDITDTRKAEEERIRTAEEQRTARNIQRHFLPHWNPELPGYDIAGKSLPAQNVGGDYYDFIPSGQNRLGIGVGDVSGKGLPAAMVMANLQATIRCLTLHDDAPGRCLSRANSLMYRSTDLRTFVSLCYGLLDTGKHTVHIANAGQNGPIHVKADGSASIIETRGIALSVMEEVSYDEEAIALQPRDLLLLYSDGLPEAMNGDREEFGEERLLEVARNNCENGAAKLISDVFTAVDDFRDSRSISDDMTLVVVKRI